MRPLRRRRPPKRMLVEECIVRIVIGEPPHRAACPSCSERLQFVQLGVGEILVPSASLLGAPALCLEELIGVEQRLSGLEALELVQCVHDISLTLAVQCTVLERLHRVALLLVGALLNHIGLLVRLGLPGIKVARRTVFHCIVVVFRIRLEGELCLATSALDVEAKDLDPQIVFAFDSLLASVELFPLIQKLSTTCTTDGHRKHGTHFVLSQLLLLGTRKFPPVKVWRIVFLEHLSFGHLVKEEEKIADTDADEKEVCSLLACVGFGIYL
mmetsp:Transcript_9333/g.28820  ORF Transcript_9333/g.28820 Transcript_9333/m.28820 type:complete len:270 (+) Transcript_9333:234-1043(+)